MQGNLIDIHGNIIQYIPLHSHYVGSRRLEVLGPGYAPFKQYLRPKYFYFRVFYSLK